MISVCMNSKNSKTFDHYRLLLNLTDKIDLRRKDIHIALSNLTIYYILKFMKKSYKNIKLKISDPTCNEELELPVGSYSMSDIQDYFEYIYIYIHIYQKSMAKRQLILQ